jgi:hypothetical protein
MDHDGTPLDSMAAAALVVRVVCEIDERSFEQRDILLTDLLCAAWPSCTAQDQ